MSDRLLEIAVISLGIVIGVAILIVILARLKRWNQRVNRFVGQSELIGLTGTVQIPFDRNSQGKVRVKVRGNLLDFTAITESEDTFAPGETVLILQLKENKVVVISEKYLRRDS
ncbi:NfeD family protein [Pannus brasiliensis CCIBt3594]|uniref:NfeD family protein n=1 Tax=Pannus brasiliensis CCIBt3594 TaxID=1427578 RepID=A0AAW9QY58_9CHRO